MVQKHNQFLVFHVIGKLHEVVFNDFYPFEHGRSKGFVLGQAKHFLLICCCIIKKIVSVNATSNMIGHITPNASMNSTV